MTKTAALFVDAQKGFTELCPAELPVKGGQDIVPALLEMASLATVGQIYGSADNHPYSATWINAGKTLQPVPGAGPDVDVFWPAHCLSGTEGAQLLDGLPHYRDFKYFVWKGNTPDMHPYSCVYHDLHQTLTTGLIEVLRAEGVETVLVGGLAYEFCVKSSALDLAAAGFKVIVYVPAVRAVSESNIYGTNVQYALNGVKLAADLEQLKALL